MLFRSDEGQPPTAVIVENIDTHRDKFGVVSICAALPEQTAPST
ncbi:hypothetical protein [Mycobacterium lepromatosis]|nr:hypothetical protein [Mycobacterium lepromatosis]